MTSEQLRNRILGTLIQMSDSEGLDFETLDRLHPVDTREEVSRALSDAEQLGFVHVRGFRYWPTIEGREEYTSAVSRVRVTESAREWKLEALSGVVQSGKNEGKRSAIDCAAIPGKETRGAPAIPDMIGEIRKLEKLAKHLDLSIDELREGIRVERVRRCSRCGETSVHQSRGDGSGSYRSHCPECRAIDAREYRARKRAEREVQRRKENAGNETD